MMPYMPFICVAALCMAVLNSLRVFAIPAMTSVLLNIVWILVLLVICPLTSDMFRKVHYLAWGILIAGIIQFLFQLPCMIRQKVKPVPDFRWRSDPRIKKVFLLMGPAAVGMGVFQINTLIDKFLAFWVSTWAPAALSFCERLVYLPLGVFATAMGTVLLPTFSRQTARDDAGAILKTLNTSLRSLMLITVPSAIGLFALAGPIVQLVFEWKGGMFDALSTERTMRALMFLSPGLIVFSLHKIFVPVFYAHQDTKTPVKIGIMAVVLNLVLNITFILTWPFEYKHAGIALATVLSSTVNAVILGCIISARIGSPGWRSIGLSFLMFVISGLVMAFAVRAGYGYLLEFLVAKGFSGKVCQLLAVIMAICEGVVVYCVLVFILARRDITNLIKKFIHRV